MRILYYDCFSGISGDMNLAAMMSLGVDENHLRSELSKLGLDDEFELQVTGDSKFGIHGTRVEVITKPHGSNHNHHMPHRHLADITSIINNSTLSEDVKKLSIAIFRRLAEAEAHVHNSSIEEVHFHEVGATDAIIDIVGAAICRESLGVDAIWCSSIQLGGGFVDCAHGRLPVPTPATVEILNGIPSLRGAVNHETTTPTGAAILAEIVDKFSDTPDMIIDKTAYGIGHRDMDIPNVLRVQLATLSSSYGKIEAVLLECSIDDMTGEALAYAMERLFEAGADDVNLHPVIMKKSRPGTQLSVLCAPLHEAALKKVIFKETTTLGIKRIAVSKTVLDRRSRTCNTKFGKVTIKEALLNGKTIRAKPEFEDCARLARQHDVSLAEISRAAMECNETSQPTEQNK